MEGMRTAVGLGSALVVAALLAGCGQAGVDRAGVDKAGGDSAVVTLRVATDDDPGRPGAEQIEHFAEQVDALSQGRVRIEPDYDSVPQNADDFDQVAARAVVSGDHEMAMVPARAWDTEGVTSFRALHAPLLVTTEEHLSRVVSDPVAGDILAGLDAVGVTGLGLYPEGLRHLFLLGEGAGERSPLDLAGGMVWSPTSATNYATIEALGGRPDDLSGVSFDQRYEDGSLVAAELSYALAGNYAVPAVGVAGLTLYPKVNSLVVNSAVFDGLAEQQRSVLREAAARTLEWSVAALPADAELADGFCRGGGRIVDGGDDLVTEARSRLAPVVDELARDPSTAALIDRITALGAGIVPPAGPAPCAPTTISEADLATGVGAFPPGVYRMELPTQVLLDAGVDPVTARDHDGTFTLTFNPDGSADDGFCPGTWSVEAGRMAFNLAQTGSPECSAAYDPLLTAGWRLDGDQLMLLDVLSGEPAYQLLMETMFGSLPFTRIS